jgi:hypothetical protein
MISSESKRKPKAFQFIEGTPSASHEDPHDAKENFPPRSRPDAMIPLDSGKQSPLTPLNATPRLPLTHLIGQAPVKIYEDLGQQDELLWKPSTPGSQITPGKKRKRARSSSPPSVNTRQFKTPKPDPASEVWTRYHANLNDSALRASQSGLEKLLIESSPRSSETAGSVGGLRRYNSCGYQWPTSKKKKKKRRTDNLHNTLVTHLEENDKSAPAVSKVSLLLEEVQRIQAREKAHDLNEAREGDIHAVSTAASPVTVPKLGVEEVIEAQESPLQNRGDPYQHPLRQTQAQTIPIQERESFCEYDDEFDINDDELDQLIASTSAPPVIAHTIETVAHVSPYERLLLSTDEFDHGALSGNEWDQVTTSHVNKSQADEDPAQLGNPSQEKVNFFDAPEAVPEEPSLDPSFDEFDDVNLEDFEIAEAMNNEENRVRFSHSSSPRFIANEPESLTTKSSIQRYRINSINESKYTDNCGREQNEKASQLSPS